MNFFEYRFGTPRRTLPVPSNAAQTLLFKAVLEHALTIEDVACFIMASSAIQNSSFAANLNINFQIDRNTIKLLNTVLHPASCFSLQLIPQMTVDMRDVAGEDLRSVCVFLNDLVDETDYFKNSLTNLAIHCAKEAIIHMFLVASSHKKNNDSEADEEEEEEEESEKNQEETFNAWPSLTSLDLAWSEPSKKTIQLISTIFSLPSSPNLRSLNLDNCNMITDADVKQLVNITSLTSLEIPMCKNVTDEGMEAIATLPNLTKLDICLCIKVTDVGIQNFGSMSSLVWLSIDADPFITDQSIERIATIGSLKTLIFSRFTGFTEKGRAKLAQIMPYCQIQEV